MGICIRDERSWTYTGDRIIPLTTVQTEDLARLGELDGRIINRHEHFCPVRPVTGRYHEGRR